MMEHLAGTVVVYRAPPEHRCDLPGWRDRRRAHIRLGDRVECLECHRVWVWQVFNGWETSWKAWERC